LSIDFYDRNSARFFAETVDADMSESRSRFLQYVPRGGSILDAGCGSGRDARAFKDLGYAVAAFDGSAEMVRLARAYTGLPVEHRLFNEVEWDANFDGIWSCASLLHVARVDLPDAFQRLARALRPGGAWFISFKYGTEERASRERRFTDMTDDLLASQIGHAGLEVLELWRSQDVRPERAHETWLSAIARRS
jgi:SAM-dependent methyltransferase